MGSKPAYSTEWYSHEALSPSDVTKSFFSEAGPSLQGPGIANSYTCTYRACTLQNAGRARTHLGRAGGCEIKFLMDYLLLRIHLIIEMTSVDRPCAMGGEFLYSRWLNIYLPREDVTFLPRTTFEAIDSFPPPSMGPDGALQGL